MAIRHGKAGQFGKSQATQRSRRVLITLAGLATYGMAVMGFAAVYSWAHFGAIIAVGTMIIAAALMTLLVRRVDPYLERMGKERIKYMRGGQGEGLIAWLLEDLYDEWHIFNGVQLYGKGDIDHVIVGPGGVFVIETKSQRGIFSGSWDGL